MVAVACRSNINNLTRTMTNVSFGKCVNGKVKFNDLTCLTSNKMYKMHICHYNCSHAHFLQQDCPVVIAAIFISGIGGTFQYGFSISVMTSPSPVSRTTIHSEMSRNVDFCEMY